MAVITVGRYCLVCIASLIIGLSAEQIQGTIHGKTNKTEAGYAETQSIDVEMHHLIVFHARKASGTTTRLWMKEMARVHSSNDFPLDVLHFEAYSFIHDKVNPSSNTKQNANAIQFVLDKYQSNGNLFVLTVREPIARVISQYDFEWRWGCQNCGPYDELAQFNLSRDNYMAHKSRVLNASDAEKYKFANIEMDDLLDRVQQFEINDDGLGGMNHWSFAVYLQNYYLWMLCCDSRLCNINKHFAGNRTKLQECLQTARKLIQRIDLILISEWLNDMRLQHYVNRVVQEYVGESSTRHTQMVFPPVPFSHSKLSGKYAYNKMISESAYQRLQEWNKWDIKLYRYFKKIAYQRIRDSGLDGVS